MLKALVITPVKNSLDNTLETIKAVASTNTAVHHYIYDDFSDAEVSQVLAAKSTTLGYSYIHLSELTNTPSPNYLTVLKNAQEKALELQVPLIIVESDVVVKTESFNDLLAYLKPDTGMVGNITVDEAGEINFPYLKFKKETAAFIKTNRSLSFCCTLLSVEFLKKYSFSNLEPTKDWFDTIISEKSIELGFKNYVLLDSPVFHKPHGSRPWKHLKYTNPLKYYWLKFTQRRDKI